MVEVYIGIGSNINPEGNVASCMEKLGQLWPEITFSSLYRTAARDHKDQADFLNAVARFETDEPPEEIHVRLQQIEQELGKDIQYEKGPRTIDLDLLLYGDACIQLSNSPSPQLPASNPLVIPHPRMHERRFVLEPLCELMDADGMHPVLERRWGSLLEEVSDQDVVKLVQDT